MADEKLYTTEEAMRILGIKSKTAFFAKVKRHGLHPEKQWRYCFFTEEMIGDLKNDRRRGRPRTEKSSPRKIKTASAGRKKAYYWRVSVWNDELCAYVVAKCGLTRKEADALIAGKDAVKKPCWRR
ncbi:hypothetical protein [uncultured Treponema sp.]|jgi:hypothetical protein|uniref:hypothetical protein n=1 Tax=uncultured Treponema sp. TaxID=162155 RepID=UPI00280B9187|nr:hypothetical protein [uncultured Treponema sp.]